MKKKISIFSPCYNEEGNLNDIYEQVTEIMKQLPEYDYEYVFIDNCSTDMSPEILRELATKDKRVKVIYNEKNFGPGRSGAYGFLQTVGDASICLASDLQDPPEYIPQFVKEWEKGYKVVWGKKAGSKEGFFIRTARKLYYKIIKRFSESEEYEGATGYGLYDREVINLIREVDDPIPNFRHLIADFGYKVRMIEYVKPERKAGKSSYNFFSYFSTAMESLVSTSKAPLRLATLIGFFTAILSFVVGMFYLVMKLVFWNSFSIGSAPLVIGFFFVGSVQLFFIGVLGEYVGAISTRVTKRPLVVVKERLNFDEHRADSNEMVNGE